MIILDLFKMIIISILILQKQKKFKKCIQQKKFDKKTSENCHKQEHFMSSIMHRFISYFWAGHARSDAGRTAVLVLLIKKLWLVILLETPSFTHFCFDI